MGQSQPFAWPRKVDVLGVGVSVTDYDGAAGAVLDAAEQGERGIVACQAVHAVVTAAGEPALRDKMNSFELVTPDGQPVRWAMNLLHGAGLRDRVYGPELMRRCCHKAAERGVPVFLYGGTPEVLEKLQENLRDQCPGLVIAGAYAPPFRPLTPEEDRDVIERINASGARLVFIGLGCPKQDLWAHDHRPHLRAILLCVGAAFDFHAGVKKTAPAWMQKRGLEWFFRLSQEPKRLWKRYLVTNSLFLYGLGKQWLSRGRRRSAAARHEPAVPAETASAS